MAKSAGNWQYLTELCSRFYRRWCFALGILTTALVLNLSFLVASTAAIAPITLPAASTAILVPRHFVNASHPPTTPSPAPSPAASSAEGGTSLLERGRQCYQAGQFVEAIALWNTVLQTLQAHPDNPQQALVLNYLSLAYQAVGQWEAARGAIAQSLALLQSSPRSLLSLQGQALTTQGSLYWDTGHIETALEIWEQSTVAYRRASDWTGVIGSQINQSQAWQALGFYRRALDLLEQVQETLHSQPNSSLKVAGFRSLGTVLRTVGDLQRSKAVLEEALSIAQSLGDTAAISTLLLGLGNAEQSLGHPETALHYYEQALAKAVGVVAQTEIRLNQTYLLTQMQRGSEAQQLLQAVQPDLVHLTGGRRAVELRVNWAERWITLWQQGTPPDTAMLRTVAEELAIASQHAHTLQDNRAESLALGQLGNLYEQTQQWQNAQTLTQQALSLSQSSHAEDLTYRWQWQKGRLLRQQGDRAGAIAAYQATVETLRSLRVDLVAMSADVQFSFRQQIDPIYREFMSLLLVNQANQEELKQARQAIEALQLAELDNFFRSACLKATPQPIDQIDPQAAVIYPMILPDQLAVVLSIPHEPLHYYHTNLPQRQVEAILEAMLQSLNPVSADSDRLRLSQELYNWLVRPTEPLLTQHNIKTLVFAPDGNLRSLPMAALHDGDRYLIEKYSIALTPGLQLMARSPLPTESPKVLMGGLSQARQGFTALPGVEVEIEQIADQVAVGELLLNQRFTQANLRRGIDQRPFPVIHLATHGQFSSNPQETFILTWDGRLGVQDFHTLLQNRTLNPQNPLELLILSACQTAAGDDRAALGLAGLAVRSGAQSTVASLWAVSDRSTALLMSQFYQAFNSPNRHRRIEALQQAQIALLKNPTYAHPYYWSAFVWVGNWL